MSNVIAKEFINPEFNLKLSITGVGVDVRLNNIPVEFEMFGGHSTMTYDVNESVIAGRNEISVVTFPYFGKSRDEGQTISYNPEAEITVELLVHERGDDSFSQILSQIHLVYDPKSTKMISKSISIDGVDNANIVQDSQPISYPFPIIENQIVFTRNSLPVQKNYYHWAWQDGMDIKNTQENFDSLLAFYKEIYDVYETKDVKRLFELQNKAAEEFAKAYYLQGGISEGHKFIETGEILNNPDVKLLKFHTKNVIFDVMANGKMARIVDIGQYHPIVFRNKTNGLFHKLKFAFYKNQNNEWVMIR